MNEYAAIMQTFPQKPTILFETFEFEKREVLKVRIIHSGAADSPPVVDLLKAIAQDFIVLDAPRLKDEFESLMVEKGLMIRGDDYYKDLIKKFGGHPPALAGVPIIPPRDSKWIFNLVEQAEKNNSKAAKSKTPRKTKRKKITLPAYYEAAKKWVIAWYEAIEPLLAESQSFETDYDELRYKIKTKTGLVYRGNETIKKIIKIGKSKNKKGMPTLLELDRKFNK